MIKEITVTNYLSESVVLNLRSPEQSGFFIKGVEGLGPVKATINTRESLALDGSIYNSAKANSRNIVFKLGFLDAPTIEDVRNLSYKYFPLKKPIDIIVETDSRISKTQGYVESNEPDIFSREEGTVISVLCPNSYFYSNDSFVVEFSSVINGFTFPFSNESLTEKLITFSNLVLEQEKTIVYTGDAPVGVKVIVHFLGAVTEFKIHKLETLEFIGINDTMLISQTGAGFGSGDTLEISTIKGEKYIRLIRDGVTWNILGSILSGSKWFVLDPGDNTFLYEAATGLSNMEFRIEYQLIYEGI